MYAAQHLLFFFSTNPHLRNDLWLQIGTETAPRSLKLFALSNHELLHIWACRYGNINLFCKGGMWTCFSLSALLNLVKAR